jgi:hypothetical protein
MTVIHRSEPTAAAIAGRLAAERSANPRSQRTVCASPGLGMPVKQSPRVDDPDYWRFRATTTRELAKESIDASTKSVLEKIAETYEALAERAEERLRKPQV